MLPCLISKVLLGVRLCITLEIGLPTRVTLISCFTRQSCVLTVPSTVGHFFVTYSLQPPLIDLRTVLSILPSLHSPLARVKRDAVSLPTLLLNKVTLEPIPMLTFVTIKLGCFRPDRSL